MTWKVWKPYSTMNDKCLIYVSPYKVVW
jgi:hypothetical protein